MQFGAGRVPFPVSAVTVGPMTVTEAIEELFRLMRAYPALVRLDDVEGFSNRYIASGIIESVTINGNWDVTFVVRTDHGTLTVWERFPPPRWHIDTPDTSKDALVTSEEARYHFDGQTGLLVLLLLVLLALPAVEDSLSQEFRDVFNSYVGVISLVLAVIWRMQDKRKR